MVSIILPVYNTGEILRFTVESIIAQTHKEWELLIIDDGSTDISKDICDEYAEKDSRISVFHKANGGICNARNYGLSRAKGDYIAFCDHDDLYDERLLETVIRAFDHHHSDIICYRYYVKSDLSPKCPSTDLSILFGDYPIRFSDYSDSLCELYDSAVIETVWSMVYKTSFIKQAGIRFDESFKFGGEDINFNIRLSLFHPSIVFLSECLYTHFIRGSLSTSAKVHPENADLMLRHLQDLNNAILSLNIDYNRHQLSYSHIFSKLLQNSLSLYVRCGYSKKQFIDNCTAFKNTNIFPELNTLALLSNKEKVIFYLHKRKYYSLLFIIFKLKWRFA